MAASLGSPDCRITLYDTDHTIVSSNLTLLDDITLTPGRYYIKVEDETGLFTGDYFFIYGIPDEPGQPIVIEFTDSNLEAAIRDILDVPDDKAIYASDVEAVQKLDLSDLDIESLDGLEYFNSLLVLELRNNRVTDLTPLQNLYDLVVLDLRGNDIADISPLCNLDMLWQVDASENAICTLPADFSAMLELCHLDLSHNEIIDLTSETLPAIETLFLQGNQIDSLAGLSV